MTQTTQRPAYEDDTARRQRARKRAEDVRGLYIHLMIYLTINAGLVILDVVLGDEWWFYWVAIPWGICLAAHAVAVLGGRLFGAEWEQRKIDDYLRQDDTRRR